MGARARRFVAMIGLALWLAFYVWLVTVIAGVLPDSFWIDLIFYPVAGIAWGIPLIPLLRWAENGGQR